MKEQAVITAQHTSMVIANVQETSTEQLWDFINKHSADNAIFATVAIKNMEGIRNSLLRGDVFTFAVVGYGKLVGGEYNGRDFLQIEMPMHGISNVRLNEVITLIAISEIPF